MDHTKNILSLVLASDATGDTMSVASAAVTSQFEGLDIRLRLFRFIRTSGQMASVQSAIPRQTDIVLYTLSNRDHAQQIAQRCQAVGVHSFALLDSLLDAVPVVTGQRSQLTPGVQYAPNTKYIDRVAVIDYAVSHDDGLSSSHLGQADVLVLGVSRTSKAPKCIYLAYQGIRAADIPLVLGPEPSAQVMDRLSNGVKAVGLVASVEQLANVRKTRMTVWGQAELKDYTNRARIQEELVAAGLFFAQHGIPVIDVTRWSIKETVAAIRDQVLEIPR